MKSLNRITKSVSPKSLFDNANAVIDATISFNQGDLLVIDATNHLLRAQTTGDTGSEHCGIATMTVVNGKPKSPYATDVDAAQAVPAISGPVYGVECSLVLKTADAINPGEAVYPDVASGTYHVTSVAGATPLKAIGIYNGPAIASATAGQVITVLLGCRAIDDTLKF